MAAAEPERQVYIRGYSVQVTTGRNNHALIAQFIGNLRHVRLRVGHEQVFSLRAVDRVAEAPSADRLVADYEDWFDGIPSANDVKICAADRGECDTNHRFAGPRRAGAELHQC